MELKLELLDDAASNRECLLIELYGIETTFGGVIRFTHRLLIELYGIETSNGLNAANIATFSFNRTIWN